MQDDSLISIIIPTYNRGYIIKETLNSVLDQTYTNWECVIIDDGGNDDTFGLIKNYIVTTDRFKYFKRPSNLIKGVSSCRNYGITVSKGDFIIFLDSDDVLASYALSSRIKHFKQFPNNDFLVFTTQYFEGKISNKLGVFNIDPPVKNRENYLSLFLNHEFSWQTMSPIWKRSILLKYKFRNELYLLEDVIFHIEILFNTDIKFKRIDEIDNYYRISNWGKNNNSEGVSKIFDSVSFLLKNYNEQISEDSFLEKKFRRFVKIIYLIIIKSNKTSMEKKKLLNYLKTYNYISSKENFLFKVYAIIYKLKLNNKKDIGMYKLMNFLNKRLFQ
ncbi:glycosyltransferase family 2 protein [Flavobacterium sp. FZUC8N2.13]|uniref:Glycosyltransferase family 2 protein n=1 Tax=Flavobacterium zubiriense TaxID=3138075 RepID=A0ABV4T7J1_9FLAO